jgi:LacI family transcriptional regulator
MLSTSQERIAGAREVFLAHSLEPANFIVQEIESNLETGKIEEFPIGPEPTALLCVTDSTAVYLLQLARKAGMKVPEDVAIASFDTQNWFARPEYDITAVRLPADMMGEQAVKILAERIGGDARPIIHLKSKGKLIVRSSTDPKKKKSFPREMSYSIAGVV